MSLTIIHFLNLLKTRSHGEDRMIATASQTIRVWTLRNETVSFLPLSLVRHSTLLQQQSSFDASTLDRTRPASFSLIQILVVVVLTSLAVNAATIYAGSLAKWALWTFWRDIMEIYTRSRKFFNNHLSNCRNIHKAVGN